jgi:uncharacterized protein YndB with AHSA1/START domain
MTGRVSASRILHASTDDVFDAITDISRLPEWNRAITAVIEQPDRLEVGAQWIVEMHALGQSWHSRSVVETLDPNGRCFAYRSVTDDGNPSYALWTWVVAEHPDGALVTVAGELHPQTFWRRVLLVRIRTRQLANTELTHSLAALEAVANRTTGARHGTNPGGS